MAPSESGGSSTDATEAEAEGEGEDAADDALPEERLDVAPGGGGPGGDGPVGCDKVDLLFVIDNSISMADDQAKLIAAFPGFAAAVRSELADVDDYHVGVITSSPHNHSEPASCRELGDLTNVSYRLNEDFSSTVTPCGPYASGDRYMSAADDLETKFSCTAAVGDGGSSIETMADAMLAALQPDKNAAGGCNEGFLREDALLVLVLLADEDDEWSAGGPQQWADAVVSAKGGYANNVVVLSLLWQQEDAACSVSVSESDGEALTAFTERFEQGFVGSLCSADYASFFAESVNLVIDGCGEFIPPPG